MRNRYTAHAEIVKRLEVQCWEAVVKRMREKDWSTEYEGALIWAAWLIGDALDDRSLKGAAMKAHSSAVAIRRSEGKLEEFPLQSEQERDAAILEGAIREGIIRDE